MAFAPSRMNAGLRLTPRASPGFRSPTTKSPIKPVREEQQCLTLKKVIGTTATSNNALDSLQSKSCFAYTAGAAVVVVTVAQDHSTTQRTFRAKASSGPTAQATPCDPTTPLGTPQTGRRNTLAPARDAGPNVTYFGSPLNDNTDSPSSRATALRERTKAATCVSLSPDGKFVAVGEVGYKPRVLVFSLSKDSPTDGPVSCLMDHAFGVRCLSFSPTSQYLASLGDINDGFLYLWTINPRTGAASPYAVNRCTSNVRDMAWIGENLVTVGTRHVKVWRMDKPTQTSPSKRSTESAFSLASPSKALAGRNCLLGPLLDKTYTAVVPIGSDRAIVCSDQGDICLMDDSMSAWRFQKVAEVSFSITAACVVLPDWLTVAGPGGEAQQFHIKNLLSVGITQDMLNGGEQLFEHGTEQTGLLAMASLGQQLVTLDSRRSVKLHILSKSATSGPGSASLAKRFAAHNSAVLGVEAFVSQSVPESAFLSYSADGCVIFWNYEGECVKEIQVAPPPSLIQLDDCENEVRALKASADEGIIISGDRVGSLRVSTIATGDLICEVKAHSGEITSIGMQRRQDVLLIATASRDRTLQIYQYDNASLTLLQTLEDHLGAVTGVCFTEDGQRLVSCATDRSVIVREALTGEIDGQKKTAFVLERTLPLKASPLWIETSQRAQESYLAVSTIDKNVTHYTLENGNVMSTFRAADDEDGDPVILNSIAAVPQDAGLDATVAGISSTDKSIRLYDDKGRLVCREYGHTEGMTGVVLIKGDGDNRSLVTVATDGTIFLWTVASFADQLTDMLSSLDVADANGATTPRASTLFASRPPLRRVLSTSELQQLQGSDRRPSESPVTPVLVRARSRSPPKRTAKLSMMNTPQLDPTPPSRRRINNSVEPFSASVNAVSDRRASSVRPKSPVQPTPASPRRVQPQQSQTLPRQLRRQSSQPVLSSAARRQSVMANPRSPAAPATAELKRSSSGDGKPIDFGSDSLATSTERICRSLHAYRRRLATSDHSLAVDNVRELERELAQTAKVLADKATRNEAVMEKLLGRYSERLVEMLDERIEERVRGMVSSTPGHAQAPLDGANGGGQNGFRRVTPTQVAVRGDA